MTLDDEIDALWQTPRCLAFLEWYQELFPLTDETRPMTETENPNDHVLWPGDDLVGGTPNPAAPGPTCGFLQPVVDWPPRPVDPWAVPWVLIGDKLVREDHVISVGAPDSDGDCLVRWRDGRAFSETSCVRIPFTRFVGTAPEAAAWLLERREEGSAP